MNPVFLDVDLEICSTEKPSFLEKEMKEIGAMNLYSGPGEHGYLSTFEIFLEESSEGVPDRMIAEFIRTFNRFGSEAKEELKNAVEIVFDLGYESNTAIEPTSVLKEDTLSVVNSLGAKIRITIYEPTREQGGLLDSHLRLT